MKQGVQPGLKVQKMLLQQFVRIICVPCSKAAEMLGVQLTALPQGKM